MTDIQQAIDDLKNPLHQVRFFEQPDQVIISKESARTILTALQQQQPRTNFEKWKQELTLENLVKMFRQSCMCCPLLEQCTSVKFRLSKSCSDLVKEWGEADANT